MTMFLWRMLFGGVRIHWILILRVIKNILGVRKEKGAKDFVWNASCSVCQIVGALDGENDYKIYLKLII